MVVGSLTMNEALKAHEPSAPNLGTLDRAQLTVAEAARRVKLSRSKIYRDISRGNLGTNRSDTGKITLDVAVLERAYGSADDPQDCSTAATHSLPLYGPAIAAHEVGCESLEQFAAGEKSTISCNTQQHDFLPHTFEAQGSQDQSIVAQNTNAELRDRDEQIVLLTTELQDLELKSAEQIAQLQEQLNASEAHALELGQQIVNFSGEASELGGAEVGRSTPSRLKHGLRSRPPKIDRFADGLLKSVAIGSLILALTVIVTVLVFSTRLGLH
jgi:hypothetical protein